jgi:uncharacterized surface protein with fasciclin (FAS1) repeats
MRSTTFAALTAAALFAGSPALAQCSASQNASAKTDIIETAVNAGSFKTLAAALEAADLVGALKSDGPFTVFAPTDAAFAKLPAGTVEALLKPENKDKLRSILLYHVVPGNVEAAHVVKLASATTLNGQRVAIDAKHGVKVDGASVAKADVRCSNGVIHVIDSVLIPRGDAGRRVSWPRSRQPVSPPPCSATVPSPCSPPPTRPSPSSPAAPSRAC